VNVKLVTVRVVARDGQGHAVGNLRKEDFQLFDRGKPQTITQFDVEQPGSLTAKARETSEPNPVDISGTNPARAATTALPERFVAYFFDDVHLEFADLVHARDAAERHIATLQPTDRAAIFTTSGLNPLEFTDDRAQLHAALARLRPNPVAGNSMQQCPDISYYQADQIINKNDPIALQVALQEAAVCQLSPQRVTLNVTAEVNAISQEVLNAGMHEARIALGTLADVVRNVSRMPGQRSIIMVSPGFIIPDLQFELNEIVDRALHSQVLINTIDARGLYVPVAFGDVSRNPAGIPATGAAAHAQKSLIENAAASAQADVLAILSDSSGGVFFHNNNDLDEGFRRAGDTPEYSYLLSFVPQNLKLDGSFHTLKLKLNKPQRLTLQSRRGYYAPKGFTNPEEQAKQEIADEVFSQEELHNLPVKLHTQFFKSGDDDAKLTVLAHLDVRHLRFRKVDGRNDNVLTCVSAVFNRNGNFLQGAQKVVTMHWKDDTLEHKLDSGITLKTDFDVKPGTYLVRLVVRDAEGQMMSAENGTVEIR
jgi:VWFA-related protein